jgi:hypothetical protein
MKTAEDFLWAIVREARWRGYMPNGFVADVLSVYVGFHVFAVRKRNSKVLYVQIAQADVHEFRNRLPEAELSKRFSTTQQGLVTLELPIRVELELQSQQEGRS